MPTPNKIDRLIDETLNLSPAALWSFFDQLAGRPEVTEAGWRIAERRLSHRHCAERDSEMLRRHREGASYAALAMDFGLLRSAAAKACQRAAAFSVHLETMSTADAG